MSDVKCNKFELEQSILKCWGVIDDINLLADFNSSQDKYKALAEVYEIRFQQCWNIFEGMIKEGNIK